MFGSYYAPFGGARKERVMRRQACAFVPKADGVLSKAMNSIINHSMRQVIMFDYGNEMDASFRVCLAWRGLLCEPMGHVCWPGPGCSCCLKPEGGIARWRALFMKTGNDRDVVERLRRCVRRVV